MVPAFSLDTFGATALDVEASVRGRDLPWAQENRLSCCCCFGDDPIFGAWPVIVVFGGVGQTVDDDGPFRLSFGTDITFLWEDPHVGERDGSWSTELSAGFGVVDVEERIGKRTAGIVCIG